MGSVDVYFLSHIDLKSMKYLREQLSKEERSGLAGWRVSGDLTTLRAG